jgi:hypothetical protein
LENTRMPWYSKSIDTSSWTNARPCMLSSR